MGITRFCIHPQPVVRGIEKVGGTKTPRVERIEALAPDLVLLNEEENRREDYEALSRTLRVEASFPKTVAEVPDHLRWLGDLVDRTAAAERRARELESALASLTAIRSPRPDAAFRFAYLIWKDPWMAVGPDTYVDDLLGLAGGRNVFAEQPERYPTFELSELARLGTEVVLLADEPFPFKETHVPEVDAAVPGAVVECLSGDDCCWHGVRSIRGVRLARALFERHAR